MGNDIETIVIYCFVGFMCLITIFVMVILPIVLTKKYNKDQKKKIKEHVRFTTPYCSFLLEDTGETGYEGEIEWEFNPGTDKSCGLFFETDRAAFPPEGGYAAYAMSQSEYTGVNDLEVEKLVQVLSEFEDVRPGKCYRRLESILSDRKRVDTEIRQYIADYFFCKPDLIEENSTMEDLMNGIRISFISVYRNGVVEYYLYDAKGIYVEELRVVIKEDGTKDIHYKAF